MLLKPWPESALKKTMGSLLTLHPLSSPLKINVLCVYCMGVRSTRGRKKSSACAGKTCSLHFSAYDHLRLSAINLSTGLTKQHLGGETVRTQPHNIGFVCLFVWIVTKGTPKRKFSARTENWKITSENPNNKRGYKRELKKTKQLLGCIIFLQVLPIGA